MSRRHVFCTVGLVSVQEDLIMLSCVLVCVRVVWQVWWWLLGVFTYSELHALRVYLGVWLPTARSSLLTFFV